MTTLEQAVKAENAPQKTVVFDRFPLAILGVPFDNLTLSEAATAVIAMVAAGRKDRRPRLVATVNVDFLVNSLSWCRPLPRHPELIAVLRQADLCTADGMPIVWLSRLLGTPLPCRVTGADLTPKLAEAAAEAGYSLFFLGGSREAAEAAAEIFKYQYPNLTIAGIDTPFVHTQGEKLADAELEDPSICARINDSGADILLIAFGNPKQELWFQRNRHRLRVPVSIGIGGTFNFLAGTVERAPSWMQRSGLEWIYRIRQEPGRLWRRYALGLVKFSFVAGRAVLGYQRARLFQSMMRSRPTETRVEPMSLFLLGRHTVCAMTMPAALDSAATETLAVQFARAFEFDGVVLDFRGVTSLTPAGLGLCMTFWQQAAAAGLPVYGAANRAFRRCLADHKVLDMLAPRLHPTVREAVSRLCERWEQTGCLFAVDFQNNCVIFRLLGRLMTEQVTELDVESLGALFSGNDCIIDLECCNAMDSTGIRFLIKIQQAVKHSGHRVLLCGIAPEIQRALDATQTSTVFETAGNVTRALLRLQNSGSIPATPQ